MLAAVSGFQPRIACRFSDYGFMSALVGGRPDVRDLQITPQPTRYIGAYLPNGTSRTGPPDDCWPPSTPT
jgi:hypothetical protein